MPSLVGGGRPASGGYATDGVWDQPGGRRLLCPSATGQPPPPPRETSATPGVGRRDLRLKAAEGEEERAREARFAEF